MPNWRTKIRDKICAFEAAFLIILDPDNLLDDQQLLQVLKKSDFDLITYRNAVEFRNMYETRYRMKWDNNQPVDPKLIVRFEVSEKSKIPIDLKERAVVLSLSVAELFPLFHAKVMKQLGTAEFDRIYPAIEESAGEQLNESETKKFLLEKIYKYPVSQISSRTDIVEALFRIHYQRIVIPDILARYSIQQYKSQSHDQFITEEFFSPGYFLHFIQKEWISFLHVIIKRETPRISFDHPSLKAYLDTFFLEGLLSPVEFSNYQNLPEWTRCGIFIDPIKDNKKHLEALLEKIGKNLPKSDWIYEDWLHFSWIWAEVRYLAGKVPPQSLTDRKQELESCQKLVEDRFEEWLIRNFSIMQSLSYLPKPIMVHQIPHFLQTKKQKKIALIVFDGLALDQWLIIRERLKNIFTMDEGSIYAWVPTLTSVSRRAIFSGKSPSSMTESLDDYESEIRYWEQFWTACGVQKNEIGYKKGLTLKKESDVNGIKDLSGKRILGLVINTIDDYIKNSDDARFSLNNRIQEWIDLGYVQQFISELINAGFDIFITSDHGNINCIGAGIISDGSTPEEKSLRVRIYQNKDLTDIGKTKAPDSIHWPEEHTGFRYSVLLSRGTSAFYNKGEDCISHGGISLEEVIVPFIHLSEGK
jgi:hypothetical protein